MVVWWERGHEGLYGGGVGWGAVWWCGGKGAMRVYMGGGGEGGGAVWWWGGWVDPC